MRIMLFCALLVVLMAPSTLAKEKAPPAAKLSAEQSVYPEFRGIKKFGSISVWTEGSGEKLQLQHDELTDSVKLAFKNHFADIPYQESASNELVAGKLSPEEFGTISCLVWTVSTVSNKDYPIAVFVECEAGNAANPRIWVDRLLGFGSKSNVAQQVKSTLRDMIEKLAITFFKARGEM